MIEYRRLKGYKEVSLSISEGDTSFVFMRK